MYLKWNLTNNLYRYLGTVEELHFVLWLVRKVQTHLCLHKAKHLLAFQHHSLHNSTHQFVSSLPPSRRHTLFTVVHLFAAFHQNSNPEFTQISIGFQFLPFLFLLTHFVCFSSRQLCIWKSKNRSQNSSMIYSLVVVCIVI